MPTPNPGKQGRNTRVHKQEAVLCCVGTCFVLAVELEGGWVGGLYKVYRIFEHVGPGSYEAPSSVKSQIDSK